MAFLRDRARLTSAGVFVGGFLLIVVSGKTIFPGVADTTVVPNGVYLRGAIVGSLSALLAIGLVLIYRANRIINFAQGALGAVAATMAAQLFQVYRVPWALAVPAGLLAALIASLLTEFFVIRRFAKAPRLILTVATIGVAQILSVIELLPNLLNRGVDRDRFRPEGLRSPLGGAIDFSYAGVRFTGDDLLVIVFVPLVLVGLAFFFRYSRYGVAARAAAENAERARLLGCRVTRVSLVVWGLAGLLSALTAILRAPILGFQLGAIQGPGLLLRALAAAVIARMESLPVTVGAAILLTMGEQTVFFAFGRAGPVEGFVAIVLVLALLFQRKQLGRVDPGASSWRAVQEVRPIPRELVRLPEVRWAKLGSIAVFLLVVILLPGPFGFPGVDSSTVSLASVVVIYAMVGVSLVALTGWSGNLSLGQWAIAGVGALVAAKLATQQPPQDFFVVLLIAGLAGTAVSVVIGLPALRIRGLFLGVTTLAFAIAAFSWFFQWEVLRQTQVIVRPVLFGIWDVTSERDFYYVTLAGLAFVLFIGSNVRRSRWGRNLIAIRDNETHAQAFGMRLVTTKLSVFALSGFLAAFAGGLYAYSQTFLAHSAFLPEISLLMFSMVVIGGMGSLTGAILGAIYVRGVQYFLPVEFQLLATGAGLLLLLLAFPGGLGQVFYSLRDRYLRWVADRRGLLVPSLLADRRIEAEAGLPEDLDQDDRERRLVHSAEHP